MDIFRRSGQWRPGRSLGLTVLLTAILLAGCEQKKTSQQPTKMRPAVPPASKPAPPASEPAQTQPVTQPATQPVGAVWTELTAENIQAGIAQIEADKDMPEAAKAEALRLCGQALGQIILADNWAAKTAEYKRGREETPKLLQDARDNLAEAKSRSEVPPVPDVPPEAMLEELAQLEAEADADLKAKQQKLNDLESEVKTRQDLMTALPEFLADARARLASLEKDLSLPPAEGEPPKLVLARQALLRTQERAVSQEIRAYEEEQRFLEARRDLIAPCRISA